MNIVYHSMTGNARYIAEQLHKHTGAQIYPLNLAPDEPYLLITHTFGVGEIPAETLRFLGLHWRNMRGVVSTGSFHWGKNFAKAADEISQKFGVPVVAKVNKRGIQDDLLKIAQWLKETDAHGQTPRCSELLQQS